MEGTISQLKEVIPFIIKNVLKSMGFNYMQATTTHIYFLNIINIILFFILFYFNFLLFYLGFRNK